MYFFMLNDLITIRLFFFIFIPSATKEPYLSSSFMILFFYCFISLKHFHVICGWKDRIFVLFFIYQYILQLCTKEMWVSIWLTKIPFFSDFHIIIQIKLIRCKYLIKKIVFFLLVLFINIGQLMVAVVRHQPVVVVLNV